MYIKEILGREILDSNGYPTIACHLTLSDGHIVTASIPSGTSTGKHEAHELRDQNLNRFGGKGVLKAIAHIEQLIAPLLVNKAADFIHADKLMLDLDGTTNKSHLGANAMLAVSMAVTRAQARAENLEVYELLARNTQKLFDSSRRTFLGAPQSTRIPFALAPAVAKALTGRQDERFLPLCMFNILNGGLHANNALSFQEFMIMLHHQKSMQETLNIATTIYHALQAILHNKGYSTSVGIEGGFTPSLTSKKGKNKNRLALDLIMQAIKMAGFIEHEIVLCLDVAASHFYDPEKHVYQLDGELLTSAELITFYEELSNDYPLFSIEDGLSQDDWEGWRALTQKLGDRLELIGDDLFVTNAERIKQGIAQQSATGAIIKPNQIGTVSQAINSLQQAHKGGFITVASHRSGETNDPFIADFAVGTGAGYFKAGACARGERVAKYNRLLEIENHKKLK
jgi:enolase